MNASDDEIDAEIEYMDKTFSDAKFSVCFKKSELEDIISTKPTIVIKNSHVIWMNFVPFEIGYDHFFHVIHLKVMSKRNIIFALIKKGLEGYGDHQSLEGIEPMQIRPNWPHFELHWGS